MKMFTFNIVVLAALTGFRLGVLTVENGLNKKASYIVENDKTLVWVMKK